MTMRLHANRKGSLLERASTTVQHEKVPDMMPTDRFTRTIALDGTLSDLKHQSAADTTRLA